MTEPCPGRDSTRWLRSCGAALIGALVGASIVASIGLRAQAGGGDLSGTWALDRNASEFPREIGFSADFARPQRGDSSQTGGGRGRRGGGGGGGSIPLPLRPQGESYDDSQRRVHLTDEVRTPPAHVTIVDTPDVVTFSNDAGEVRSVHPDGRAETLTIAGTPVLTIAHREGGKLIVLYAVEDLRQIRYTFAHGEGNAPLVVDVEFLERSTPGDILRLIYKTFVPATTTASGDAAGKSAPGAAQESGAPGGAAPGAAVPRAGSEFTGLKRVGIVVEELSSQAVACGLKREVLEAAAAKPLTDAGLKTSVNSDEETYVHVTVMTSSLPTGMCISAYEWSLYSITPATLAYQRTSLLAQVLLAHKGGLTGGMPINHGTDVARGITEGLTQIAGIIRDANK